MNIEALKTVGFVLGSTLLILLLIFFLSFGSLFIFGPTIWALIFSVTLWLIILGIYIYWEESRR